MTDYFLLDELNSAKKQRKRILIFYYVILGIYLACAIAVFVYYLTLPYKAEQIVWVKVIQYSLGGLFVIFSFLYLGIKFKRVNRYYKLCVNLSVGLKETTVASFLRYDEDVQQKDGVDCKALIFSEWNKYKKDFYERKVLVFYEKPFPEIKEGENVKFITQGNFLISYEIIE